MDKDIRVKHLPLGPSFILTFCFSLFISLNGFALNTLTKNIASIYLSTAQWVFHSEVKGVKIYYQINSCDEKDVVYLKFDNTNVRPVLITWKKAFVTKQVPEEKESFLGEKQLTLAPGVTAQSDCRQIKVKECV